MGNQLSGPRDPLVTYFLAERLRGAAARVPAAPAFAVAFVALRADGLAATAFFAVLDAADLAFGTRAARPSSNGARNWPV